MSSSFGQPPPAFEAISLGETCSVKFQITRHLYLAAHPQGDVDAVREALNTHRAGQVFTRHLFDWQITPAEAVADYLEADFAGVFERADLAVSPDWEVIHRRLHTRHPHDFHASDPAAGLTTADLDAQYAAARGRFEHLAERFRHLLRRPGRFLYVLSRWPDAHTAGRILASLSRASGHEATLLCAEVAGRAIDPAAGPHLLSATLPARIDKPEPRQWEGDDAGWEAIFARHPIRHTGPAFSTGVRSTASAPGAGLTVLPLAWRLLPGQATTALPASFTVPAAAWDYGALSEVISALEGSGRGAVELGLEVSEGRVSFALVSPDCSRLIGLSQAVAAGEGPVAVRLGLPAQAGPVRVLLRNSGEDGAGGRGEVRWLAVTS